jgi:hypothetical protein
MHRSATSALSTRRLAGPVDERDRPPAADRRWPRRGGAALDELLQGLEAARADGSWTPDPDSEARRLALLPRSAPLPWDALMHDPAYQHALERLP